MKLVVPVRMSEDEIQILKATAHAGGRTLSAEIRYRLFPPQISEIAQAVKVASEQPKRPRKTPILNGKAVAPEGLSVSERMRWLREHP